MKPADILLSIYGLLMLVGGYMGYVKAGSKPSLITGIVSGILIFTGVYFSVTQVAFGRHLLTATTAALTAVFILRFMKTRTFMPSGLLMVASLIAFMISVGEIIRR